MKDLVETTIASKLVYAGKILNLRVVQVTLPNGRGGSREVVELFPGAAVVPFKKTLTVQLPFP